MRLLFKIRLFKIELEQIDSVLDFQSICEISTKQVSLLINYIKFQVDLFFNKIIATIVM